MGGTGVWRQRPGRLPASGAGLPGQGGPGQPKLHASIQIGTARMRPAELTSLIRTMEREWPGNSYHLLHRNCNHFADEFCFLLCGRRIPSWINRLANGAGSLFGNMAGAAVHAATAGMSGAPLVGPRSVLW